MPRLWFSGPRMLNGLVRPGISFNLSEVKGSNAPNSTFICVVKVGDKTKVVATPNPFAEVAMIGSILPNPDDIEVPFIVAAAGDGKPILRAVKSLLTGRTKEGWYNVPAENLNRAIIAAGQREGIKTVPTSWDTLVAAVKVPPPPAPKNIYSMRGFFALLALATVFVLVMALMAPVPPVAGP